MKRLLAAFIISFFSFAFAIPAYATFSGTHHYICADIIFTAGTPAPTCTSNVFTISSGGSNNRMYLDISPYNGTNSLTNTTTYYLSFTYGGTGTMDFIPAAWNGPTDGSGATFSSTQINTSFVTGTDSSGQNVLFFRSGAGSFNGTLSNLCVSSSSTGCNSTAIIPPYFWSYWW